MMDIISDPEAQSDNPVQLYAAYKRAGTQYNYLGDGKGGIRLFKSEQAIRDYLAATMTPEQIAAEVTIHPVDWKIALPEEMLKADAPIPIMSLASDLPPTAQEILQNIVAPKITPAGRKRRDQNALARVMKGKRK